MPHVGDLGSQRKQILLRTIRAVATAINGPDPYMAGHSTRVAACCDGIARGLGLSEHERLLLALAASFHDIGVLSTPAYILKKPSVLAEDEMEEVRVHPIKGSEVFAADPELDEIARSIRHHHERFDGTGYPDGLEGGAIPLFSRIILVADTYDAMTHNRPYRRAVSHQEAIRRIQAGAGSQLDPRIVERFVAVYGEAGPRADPAEPLFAP